MRGHGPLQARTTPLPLRSHIWKREPIVLRCSESVALSFLLAIDQRGAAPPLLFARQDFGLIDRGRASGPRVLDADRVTGWPAGACVRRPSVRASRPHLSFV